MCCHMSHYNHNKDFIMPTNLVTMHFRIKMVEIVLTIMRWLVQRPVRCLFYTALDTGQIGLWLLFCHCFFIAFHLWEPIWSIHLPSLLWMVEVSLHYLSFCLCWKWGVQISESSSTFLDRHLWNTVAMETLSWPAMVCVCHDSA